MDEAEGWFCKVLVHLRDTNPQAGRHTNYADAGDQFHHNPAPSWASISRLTNPLPSARQLAPAREEFRSSVQSGFAVVVPVGAFQ